MESCRGLTFGNLKGENKDFGLPRIMVVGCGEAGSDTVSRLGKFDLDGITTVAISNDELHLKTVLSDKKILIGRSITRKMGSGGDPRIGETAAALSLSELEDLLKGGADLVFLTVEMGDGTGAGSAHLVAKVAKDLGAIVVSMVTTPFHIEPERISIAEDGLASLRINSDTCIVIDKNRLLECATDLPQGQAFRAADKIIARIISGFIETLIKPSLINLDWADVRTIMSTGGASFMFAAEGDLKSGSEKIVRSALRNPLLQADFCSAKACLLHMTGGPDMTLKEAAAIAGAITLELDPGANVIWGARIDPDLVGKVRLMAIITGTKSDQSLGPKDPRMDLLPHMEKMQTRNSGMDVTK